MTRDWVEVPLTRGMVAKIDRQDMLIVGRYSWHAKPSGSVGGWYARRHSKLRGVCFGEFMHNRIMETPFGMVVDHINGDGLDNRRANLRICTQGQNAANRKGRVAGAACEYLGVWCRARRRSDGSPNWAFRVTLDGRAFTGSGFRTAEDAARVRDEVAVRLHGEFATTNFPMGVGRSLYPDVTLKLPEATRGSDR